MVSKSEYKYRYKIIYEQHLNKVAQKKLDSEMNELINVGIMNPYKIMYTLLNMNTADAINYLSGLACSTVLSAESVVGIVKKIASFSIYK